MGEQWVSRLLILSLHIWLAWRKADAMMTIKELGRARQGVMCSTTNVQKTKQNNHQPFINVKFLFCFTQEIGPTQHLLQQQQKKKEKTKSESKQVGRFKSLNDRWMRTNRSHSYTQHAGREWTLQHTQCCTLCYTQREPGKKKRTQDGMKTKNPTPLNVQYINYISIYFLIVLPAAVYLTTFHLCQTIIFQSTSVGRLRSWFEVSTTQTSL